MNPNPTPSQHVTTGAPSQVVHSADAVALELPLAGPTSRILAYAIDAAILYTTLFGLLILTLLTSSLAERVLGWLRTGLERWVGPDAGSDPEAASLVMVALFVLVVAVADILYFVFWELVNDGQSPGKRVMALRVMGDGGVPLSFRDSLTRNLLRLADMLPSSYLAGLVTMIVSREGKRLGDLAAGTVVVRLDRPPVAPPLAADATAEDAPFRFRRDQVARLGPAEQALVRQTLRRLDSLDAEQGRRALERSVELLRAKLGYEDPVPPQERPAFLRALWGTMTRR